MGSPYAAAAAAIATASVALVALFGVMRWSWRRTLEERAERTLREDFDERLRHARGGSERS